MLIDADITSYTEQRAIFSPLQLSRLDKARLPKHIAIIPDGNRRWAKKRLSNILEGHREGCDTLMEAVKAAKELGVEKVTFYSFSTENWNRSPEEVMGLMLLFSQYLMENCDEMFQSGIKLETIGDLTPLPPFLRNVIQDVKSATSDCEKIVLILALNYGSRNELCRAFRTMLEDYDQGDLSKDEINEKTVARYLDTHQWGDPDLLIRTGGELASAISFSGKFLMQKSI